MAEPFLDQVKRDTGGDRGHPEPVTQPFWRGVRTGEIGGHHHGVNRAPTGHARPGPEPDVPPLVATRLAFADTVDEIEGFEQGRGNRYRPVDPAATLLEGLEHQHAGGQIDPIGGQGEGLGEAAAGIGEGHAQGPHLATLPLRHPEEDRPLGRSEIFPGAGGVEQAHALRRVVWALIGTIDRDYSRSGFGNLPLCQRHFGIGQALVPRLIPFSVDN